MQSGMLENTWKIDWDILDKWENPVMGWTSSADPMQALNIKFQTKEQAILFAERQGYTGEVQEPKEPRWTKKTYADNYTVRVFYIMYIYNAYLSYRKICTNY